MDYVSSHAFSKKQKRYLVIKRLLDVFFALVLLLPACFIMGIVCVWIKLESKGPVVYKQRRPGFHQNIFTIYKLRSMRQETINKNGKLLSDAERITKSGDFIRKTSIDELPQLFNILRGEMSFIGPRPFLINDLEKYSDEQRIRFELLPGITSWSALHGRNDQTEEEKYNHEIYYVQNISFKLDVYIFIKTVLLVLSRKGIDNTVGEGRIAAEIIDDRNR